MSEETELPETDATQSPLPTKSGRRRRLMALAGFLLALYLLATYAIVPLVWERYAHDHPAFDDNPRITSTSDGHPGDPLNVALIGSEQQVRDVMRAAGWYPATALGIKSDLKIAADTVLKRADDEAPVSSLYLYGRKEDLAYEQPVGGNPRQRNHVRFWNTSRTDSSGRTIWMGSASYDEKVGFSHTTGQITHHIAAEVDEERDHLFADLQQSGSLADFYQVPDFHTKTEGRNGGGDRWSTDGALYVGILKAADSAAMDSTQSESSRK